MQHKICIFVSSVKSLIRHMQSFTLTALPKEISVYSPDREQNDNNYIT